MRKRLRSFKSGLHLKL